MVRNREFGIWNWDLEWGIWNWELVMNNMELGMGYGECVIKKGFYMETDLYLRFNGNIN